MAQYRVKNTSHLDKAFKVYGGHQIVAAGKEGDVTTVVDLTEEQIDAFARDGVKVTAKEAKPKDDKGAEPKTAKEALALFSAEGVHVNTAKAAALKFLGDKVPADADKAAVVNKLEELAKAED